MESTTTRNKVSDMPWDDKNDDSGLYTGEVNPSGEPDGIGQLQYDDGNIVKGIWKNGEMDKSNNDRSNDITPQHTDDDYIGTIETDTTDDNKGDISNTDVKPVKKKTKEQELAEFHERNQEFLRKAAAVEALNQQDETAILNGGTMTEQQLVFTLQEQVRVLSHELRITQDANELNKTQSRAEIDMLQSEINQQQVRHEKITASLRNRLVESETARMKMQDQLSKRMEEDTLRDEDLKARWKEMTACVLEDKEWMSQQMSYWKESMEEHKKRMAQAKDMGILEAGIDTNNGGENNKRRGSGTIESETNNRRLSQRKLWGDTGEEYETDSDDEEIERMFGKSK